MEAFPQGMFHEMLIISEMPKLHMSESDQAAVLPATPIFII